MISQDEISRLQAIRTFPSLVKYLRDELGWPIESDDADELTFEYEPRELGLDDGAAVKIKEIKQLRPLTSNQPWGIFFVNFEPKRLPVVVLRRILSALVIKKRASANKANQAAWAGHDLLFISSYGTSDERSITFAHFTEEPQHGDLPALRVLAWDDQDTPLHLEHAHETLKHKLKWPLDEKDLAAWRTQWSSAFILRHREVVTTSQELACRLAELARSIRKRANLVLAVESAKGPFKQLHAAFQEALVHDLSEDGFADMYAQTVTYGLLTARVSRPAGIVAEDLAEMVPVTNPFLKELLSTFLNIGGRKKKIDFDELGINDVVELLRAANMEAVLRDFGNRNPNEDPVIHFYELFLKEYDAKEKVKRGVFYTPLPVVSFIVRSVDELLKTEFGLEDGLADITTWGELQKRKPQIVLPKHAKPETPFVQILDFATGTGTFMVEVIDIIHKTMTAKWKKAGYRELEIAKLWDEYVPKHLLPRLYGFELMMAPYAIAHMKIGLKLWETGYRFHTDERVRLYLTNTLEEPKDFSQQIELFAPALAHEAKAANKVKAEVAITTIIGNPPYAGHSSNLSYDANGKLNFIGGLLQEYYQFDGQPLKERNSKWLQDDYVKFMRWAQWCITSSGIGVQGIITNHGFIGNPTFRGMRQSLLKTYQAISIIDLHGNSNIKEKCPDGSKDENVFDILQGVSISIMVSFKKANNTVSHLDCYGLRQQKYNFLQDNNILQTKPDICQLNAPYYMFVQQNQDILKEYECYLHRAHSQFVAIN
jgi:predicted helicase